MVDGTRWYSHSYVIRKMASKMKQSVEIRISSIHGLGVFACRPFRVGEIVLQWDTSTLVPIEKLADLSEIDRCYTHPYSEDRLILVQPPERFVNHSCENNSEVENFCDVAVKDIAPGEEITSDYSIDGAGRKFRCFCKSPKCRGTNEPRRKR